MLHQLLTVSHHVARIMLHHPPANVLNLSVLKDLEQVLNEVEEDEYVRVVIVTGTGRFFCAGADLHELAHLTTVHSGSEFALRGQLLLSRIERSEKPVLVAINGTCVGGGVEAALHAIRGGLHIPLSEGLAREAELFGQLCITPDKQEAVQAFFEKRQPRLAGADA